MAERVVAETPRCPNGCIAGLVPVISDDPTVNRWQCKNIDCLRNFSTQKPGYGRPPHPDREEEKEANVADLLCDKCPGMTFKSPKSLGAHRWQKHPGEKKPVPSATKEPKARPAVRGKRTKKERKPSPRPGKSGSTPGFLEIPIKLLRDKRDELVYLHGEDLKRIDLAIAALEGNA